MLVRWRAALALRSRCARAALALRARCDAPTPASGEPEPWAVHDDGGSFLSSSFPSCCHCIAIIRANSRARALALARALSLARDDALATLVLRSHSCPCLVAPQRCARLPAPSSLAPRSRLLPRAVCACCLYALVTCRHVRHCLLRRLCLFFVCCRHLSSCAALLAASLSSIPGDLPFRALVCLGHHRRLIARRACSSTRRPTLPGPGLPWSSSPSLAGVPLCPADGGSPEGAGPSLAADSPEGARAGAAAATAADAHFPRPQSLGLPHCTPPH